MWLAVVNCGTGTRATASDHLGHYWTGYRVQLPKTGALCVKHSCLSGNAVFIRVDSPSARIDTKEIHLTFYLVTTLATTVSIVEPCQHH